jgi:hypothetical protein
MNYVRFDKNNVNIFDVSDCTFMVAEIRLNPK